MKIADCMKTLGARSPLINPYQGEVGGEFQQTSWGYHYPRHIPSRPRQLHRQHRSMRHPRTMGEQPPTAVMCAHTTPNFCSVSLQRCCQAVSVDTMAKTHLENLRQNLARRLQVAKAKGNQRLVGLLEDESRALALS